MLIDLEDTNADLIGQGILRIRRREAGAILMASKILQRPEKERSSL